jgi:hypothetical protein
VAKSVNLKAWPYTKVETVEVPARQLYFGYGKDRKQVDVSLVLYDSGQLLVTVERYRDFVEGYIEPEELTQALEKLIKCRTPS